MVLVPNLRINETCKRCALSECSHENFKGLGLAPILDFIGIQSGENQRTIYDFAETGG